MNNEQIEGMVQTADGRYAVMVDTKNGHYGWLFAKHPDGMWVSYRKASAAELSAAEHQYNSNAALRKIFADVPKAEPLTVSAIGKQPRVVMAVDFPPLPSAMSASFREHMEHEAKSAGPKFTISAGRLELLPAPTAEPDLAAVLADHNRLVRELDVLLNGEAGAADQASLCDIVAQVRMARKKPGTGSLQLQALVPDQVVGRVHRVEDVPDQAYVDLNSCGRALPEGAPLYARPADPHLRYVRAPSRKDPKYHEEWPEIEGGLVFNGEAYCKDLFVALKRYSVIVAEITPEDAVDEQ